jgi:hypothetical protein
MRIMSIYIFCLRRIFATNRFDKIRTRYVFYDALPMNHTVLSRSQIHYNLTEHEQNLNTTFTNGSIIGDRASSRFYLNVYIFSYR